MASVLDRLRPLASRVCLASLALAVGLGAVIAEAQSTGGSFGGGDFSDHGGGGERDHGSSSRHHDGSGAVLLLFRLFVFCVRTFGLGPTIVLFGLGFAVWVVLARQHSGAGPQATPGRYDTGYGRAPAAGSPVWNQVDISAIRVALDPSGRAAVERRYAELMRGGEVHSKPGMARALGALTTALEEVSGTWREVGVSNFHPMSSPVAEHHFRALSMAARSDLESDAVRGLAPGEASSLAGPGEDARAVVTLIVAARRELVDLHAPALGQVLGAFRGIRALAPVDLVAIDLVWSPGPQGTAWRADAHGRRFPRMRPLGLG